MNRVTTTILTVILTLVFAATVWAGKKEDAKAMVEKAVAMYASDGEEATFKALKDPKGAFRKANLYVYVGNMKTRSTVMHPIIKKLSGRDNINLKDVKGNLFYMEFINTAKNGGGWVTYWWPKPGEKKASEKTAYAKMVPGTELFMVCGYYK